MKIKFENTQFYFRPIADDAHVTLPEDWGGDFYYRFRIDGENEQVYVEDIFGRSFPITFNDLFDFVANIAKVQNEVLTTVVGAPSQNVK